MIRSLTSLSLYAVPNWLMGVVVVGCCLLVALAGFALFKHVFPGKFTDQEVGAAMACMGVTATITSLLLAFSAVSAWEAYNSADSGVVNEANDGAMLARDLAVYGTPEAQRVRAALKDYLKSVVEGEWPLLAKGQASSNSWDRLDTIFRLAYRIEPRNAKETVLLKEIWERINDIAKHRRERIHAAQSEIPSTLWFVVLAGTFLSSLFTLALPKSRLTMALIAGMATSLGLVLFFVLAMAHPFEGKESVGREPLELTIRNMERWDATERRERAQQQVEATSGGLAPR